MDKPTVKNILVGYLVKHGYDGLCSDGCGCDIDDLAPCCEYFGDCVPAFKHPNGCQCEGCENLREEWGEYMGGCYSSEPPTAAPKQHTPPDSEDNSEG